MSAPSTHLALLLPSAGSSLQLTSLPTPTPSPDELLISVSHIALNPADHMQLSHGILIKSYPTILGSDISGHILSLGSSVPSSFSINQRVSAFATAVLHSSSPSYGAFQQKVLVKWWFVTPLPEGVGLEEGAGLGMAVMTAWNGWWSVGIENAKLNKEQEKGKGMLVWDGGSSVGAAAIQTARWMGYTVYSTSSPQHHSYLLSIGASQVFDYHDEDIVSQITNKAKKEGVMLDTAYLAKGDIKACIAVVQAFKGGEGEAKIAVAGVLPNDIPSVEGVYARFVHAPQGEERKEFSEWVFNWLRERLVDGGFLPGRVRVVDGGLGGVEKGLEMLREGGTGEKIVVRV